MFKEDIIQNQNQKIIVAGLAQFKSIYGNNPAHSLLKRAQEILQNQSLVIESGNKLYHKIDILNLAAVQKELFTNMISFKIKRIQFSINLNNQQKQVQTNQILKSIQNVHFSQLIHLKIKHDLIDNIEQLSLIDFPNIQQICIFRTNISRIKSFAKWSNKNKKLHRVYLYANKINSIESLNKMNFKQKLTDFTLDQQLLCLLSYFEEINCQDLSIIMKLKVKTIQQFEIKLNQRIWNKQIESMIKKRFPSMQKFVRNK